MVLPSTSPAPIAPVCGLWSSPQRLLAVCLNAQGQPTQVWSRRCAHPAPPALMAWLQDRQCKALVMPQTLCKDPLAPQLLYLNLLVWQAPMQHIQAMRYAAGLDNRPDKHTAMLLARLPNTPFLRHFLQPVYLTNCPVTQLALF